MIPSFCKDIYKMLCQKYPNRKIYVIGDQHFYHTNILHYTRTNFSDIENMNEYIIRKHNETVDKEDIVIFLGDFCFKNSKIKQMFEKMNGHKYLVLGNHDSQNIIKNYPIFGLEGVFVSPIKIKNQYLSHTPLINTENTDLSFSLIVNEFKKQANSINYHGHIHTPDFISPSHRNVTCEMINYTPLMIGKTKPKEEEKSKYSFIQSNIFNDILEYLKEKHYINPSIVISDYIYTMLLEHNFPYYDNYFIQGSFGLLKKYDYLFSFSDLDISLLYNYELSKKKNITLLKEITDSSYQFLKEIDKINVQFKKRYDFICIFEALYTSNNPYFASCYFDANMIPIDWYKNTDFFSLEEGSIIEKFLSRSTGSFITEYSLPRFTVQTLKPEGDIANSLLQILFQKGQEEKKKMVCKKLEYIYNHTFKEKNMEDFSNIFTRFFLRNISFLYSLKRLDEIAYIQRQNLTNIRTYLQAQSKYPFYDILFSSNSPFSSIYQEISSIQTKETFEAAKQMIKKLK